MNKSNKLITFLLLLGSFFYASKLIGQSKYAYPPQNQIFDPAVKTVFLYPNQHAADDPTRTQKPAIIRLGAAEQLILEFDHLENNSPSYVAKIYHFNADWTQSTLREMEFLQEYNEFPIQTYETSQNTKYAYSHHEFVVPTPLISGNYLLVVYEDYRLLKRVLSKKFYVFEPIVQVNATVKTPQDGQFWRSHQQINFDVSYAGYNQMYSPKEDLKVYIRTNYQDEKRKGPYQPSGNDMAKQTLRYQYFRNEHIFPGGNEYRFLDIRSTYTRGQGVDFIQQGVIDQIEVTPMRTRNMGRYSDQFDLNGFYSIENRENLNPSIASDYLKVHFTLQEPSLAPTQRIAIRGAFNEWALDNEMTYNPQKEQYEATILLKQGLYDYVLSVIDDTKTTPPDDYLLEGNFTETENKYEFFIYHKPPNARSERLIGYALVSSRNR